MDGCEAGARSVGQSVDLAGGGCAVQRPAARRRRRRRHCGTARHIDAASTVSACG